MPIDLPQEQVKQIIENDPMQGEISAYLAARDHFMTDGGSNFMVARQRLRAAYCESSITKEAVKEYLQTIENPTLRRIMNNRFDEWDAKIALGLLIKRKNPTLDTQDFLFNLKGFIADYGPFMQSETYTQLAKSKEALREALLPEIKAEGVDRVIAKYKITDPELIIRIQHEWSWKV
ncbi:MAG: hypothetical protein S4CHLAM102_08870 [Chlamydiia bacterium]|nr:hypothetical protein [Chlamydiia bacterium]